MAMKDRTARGLGAYANSADGIAAAGGALAADVDRGQLNASYSGLTLDAAFSSLVANNDEIRLLPSTTYAFADTIYIPAGRAVRGKKKSKISQADTTKHVINIASDDVTLEGVIVSHDTSAWENTGSGIRINAKRVTLRDIVVQNVSRQGIQSFSSTEDLTIENFRVENIGRDLLFAKAVRAKVNNGRIFNTGDDAIAFLDQSRDCLASGISIYNAGIVGRTSGQSYRLGGAALRTHGKNITFSNITAKDYYTAALSIKPPNAVTGTQEDIPDNILLEGSTFLGSAARASGGETEIEGAYCIRMSNLDNSGNVVGPIGEVRVVDCYFDCAIGGVSPGTDLVSYSGGEYRRLILQDLTVKNARYAIGGGLATLLKNIEIRGGEYNLSSDFANIAASTELLVIENLVIRGGRDIVRLVGGTHSLIIVRNVEAFDLTGKVIEVASGSATTVIVENVRLNGKPWAEISTTGIQYSFVRSPPGSGAAVDDVVGLKTALQELGWNPELVINGTLTNGLINPWRARTPGSTVEVANGELIFTSGSTGTNRFSQPITCGIGKTYILKGRARRGTTGGNVALFVSPNSDLTGATVGPVSTATSMTSLTPLEFTATETTMYVGGQNTNAGDIGKTSIFDDISVREKIV